MNEFPSPEHVHRELPATPYEIATLAAKFLPDMAWPQELTMLDVGFGNFASNSGLQSLSRAMLSTGDGVVLTTWEMMCSLAIERAKTLIRLAAKKEHLGLAVFERDLTESKKHEVNELLNADEIEHWRQKFQQASGENSSIPMIEALRVVLPKSTDENRIAFCMRYGSETGLSLLFPETKVPTTISSKGITPEEPAHLDETDFLQFAGKFLNLYEIRKEAWRADIKRQKCSIAGKKGAAKRTRRAKAKKDD